MNESKTTLWFVLSAVVLLLIAFVVSPSRITPDAFLDQGEQFFPDFSDPNEAASLEVIEFSAESGQAHPFKVTFKNNRWTIPSHHDYPADAKDRLAKTAAGVLGIKKDDFRTNNVIDHEACGVIDPLDETVIGLAGRGSRITIKGKGDGVLADFIVGNEVPGRDGFRFVRIPDQNRVYASRMNLEISTNFADWINTELFEFKADQIVRIEINSYSINERSLSIVEGEKYNLSLDDDIWKMRPRLKGATLDSNKVKSMLTALEGLKIVGIRAKPEGLSLGLSSNTSSFKMSNNDKVSLQNKGFYQGRNGQLLANEGEMKIYMTDGVIATLRFGEVLYGTGLSVTAGLTGDNTNKDGNSTTETRYLFVTSEFNPGMFKEPAKPKSIDFETKPDSLWTDADRADKSSQDKWDRWQRSVTLGKFRSDALNERFAPWYYVISSEDFDGVHLSRNDLIANK